MQFHQKTRRWTKPESTLYCILLWRLYFCATTNHTKHSYLSNSRPWTHVHQCWSQTWRLPEAGWTWWLYWGVYLPHSIYPGGGVWLSGHQTGPQSQNYIPHCFPAGSPRRPRWPHWCWTRGWPKSSRHCCCTPEGSLDWRLHLKGQLGLHRTYLARTESKRRIWKTTRVILQHWKYSCYSVCYIF